MLKNMENPLLQEMFKENIEAYNTYVEDNSRPYPELYLESKPEPDPLRQYLILQDYKPTEASVELATEANIMPELPKASTVATTKLEQPTEVTPTLEQRTVATTTSEHPTVATTKLKHPTEPTATVDHQQVSTTTGS